MSGEDTKPLGYRNPPSWARFKKGQSGNPKGRPPKRKPGEGTMPSPSDVDDVLRTELSRTVVISEADRRLEMSMLKVAARAQMNAAGKGNVHAQREVLKSARELEARDAARKEQALADERRLFDYIVHRKRQRTEEWATATALGREPENPWPHPDDILIDSERRRWRIRGPGSESDVAFYRYCQAQRSYLFLRGEFERRIGNPLASAWDIWICLDVLLPKRWQIVDDLMLARIAIDAMNKRQLRLYLKQAQEHVEALKPLAAIPPSGREEYHVANTALKPILKHHGYRSLAEYEHAFETIKEALPQPRRSG